MSSVTYRLATVQDISSLVRLRAAFLAEVAEADAADPTLLEALRRYFTAALPTGEFVAAIAEAENRIVATSGLVLHRHAPSGRNLTGYEGYVLNMYTLPTWRGQGIATTLLRMILEVASDRGCPRASLHALPLGRSIYAKAGFAPVETEMRLRLVPRAS